MPKNPHGGVQCPLDSTIHQGFPSRGPRDQVRRFKKALVDPTAVIGQNQADNRVCLKLLSRRPRGTRRVCRTFVEPELISIDHRREDCDTALSYRPTDASWILCRGPYACNAPLVKFVVKMLKKAGKKEYAAATIPDTTFLCRGRDLLVRLLMKTPRRRRTERAVQFARAGPPVRLPQRRPPQPRPPWQLTNGAGWRNVTFELDRHCSGSFLGNRATRLRLMR